MTDPQTLSGIRLFRHLSPEEAARVAERCVWQRHASGAEIVGALDDGRDLYCVVRGSVRATLFSRDGKEVTFRDIGAGSVFGEYAAIDGKPRSATVVALEDTVTASLRPALFEEILRRHHEIARELMVQLIGQLRSLTERVFEFSALTVRNRIHAEILRLARTGSVDGNRAVIDPLPKHGEIASRISTHREAVARELNLLAREGLVRRRGRALEVTDLARLTRMVHTLSAVDGAG